MKEEIIKMFHRIELDKANDSCGFEFADGFSCTFDNIATCYDDRLKLYDLVKDLQSQLKAKEETINKALNKIKELYEFGNEWHWDNGAIEYEVKEIEKILKGNNNEL